MNLQSGAATTEANLILIHPTGPSVTLLGALFQFLVPDSKEHQHSETLCDQNHQLVWKGVRNGD